MAQIITATAIRVMGVNEHGGERTLRRRFAAAATATASLPTRTPFPLRCKAFPYHLGDGMTHGP